MSAHTQETVRQLVKMLEGGNAHATIEDALKGIPVDQRGAVSPHLPYSLWQLVEHMRIAQSDILEFSRDPAHQSPKWPDAYWPAEAAPPDEKSWDRSVKQINKDLRDFISLLEADDADIYKPFPHGSGQNLLREAMLIVDHASYHLGEIIVIRRLLGIWK